MSQNCLHCGNHLPRDAKTCPYCRAPVDSFAKHLAMDTFDEDLELENSEPTMQISPADFESTEDSDVSEPKFHLQHATDQHASIFREAGDYQVLPPKIAPMVSPVLNTQIQKAVVPYVPTPSNASLPQMTSQGYAIPGAVFPRQRGDVEFDQASINFIPLTPPTQTPAFQPVQSHMMDGLANVEYAKTQPMQVSPQSGQQPFNQQPFNQQQFNQQQFNQQQFNQQPFNQQPFNQQPFNQQQFNQQQFNQQQFNQQPMNSNAPSFLDELRTPPPLYVPNQVEPSSLVKNPRKRSWNLLILIALFLITTIFFALQWIQGLSAKNQEMLTACQEQAMSQELPLLQKSIESCEALSKKAGLHTEISMASSLWLTQSLLWFYEGKIYENASFVNEAFSQVLLDHAKVLIEAPEMQSIQFNPEAQPNAQLMKIQFLLHKNRLALAEDLIKEYQEKSKSSVDAPFNLLKIKLSYLQQQLNETQIQWIAQHLSALQTPYDLYFAYLVAIKLNQIALADQIKGIFLQKYPQHSLKIKFSKEDVPTHVDSQDQERSTASQSDQDRKAKSSTWQATSRSSMRTVETKTVEKNNIDPTTSDPQPQTDQDIELIAQPSLDPTSKSMPSSTSTSMPTSSSSNQSNERSNERSNENTENHNKTSGQSLDQLIKLASQALENGKSKQAETYLHQAQKISATNPKVMTLLGWCAMSTYQYGIAEARFRGALDIQASNEDALYGLGSAYEKNQKKQLAIDTYEKYLQIFSSVSRAQGVRKKLEKLKN